MSYQMVLDVHTHTLVSGHAYNTMQEMWRAAAENGLSVLGITEHAPKMPGSCKSLYFSNFRVVPRSRYGVELWLGAELNILDYEGTVDLKERDLKDLDVVIASLHLPCIRPGSEKENTRALLKAMENPYVDIIGHPDDSRYPIDMKALVEGAKETGKVLELNNTSLKPTGFREGAWENDRRMLELCREYQVPVIVNSDAHMDVAVGDFTYAIQLLEEMEFPEELVLNRSREAIYPYVNLSRREQK
ncbi:MAG: phosphatase [Blautia sp.]|jgi:putative hydrolase